VKTKALYGAAFILVFFLCNQLIQLFALRSFNVLQIDGTFSPQTGVYFSSSNGLHPILEKTKIGSGVKNTTAKQTLRIQLNDQLVSRFRLEIHH